MIRLATPKTPLLRDRAEPAAARVTNIELFFDLVFVFAVTQLSTTLRHDLTALGAVHAGMLFLAVWWVWIDTSWVTNWLDPERWPVRVFLLLLMLVGLVLSMSLPQAFGEKGLAFAAAYVVMQVGRSLFMLWALGAASPANTRNFQRITIWACAAGLFWLAGGIVEGQARLVLWGIACGIDYISPAAGFFVPGLGRSTTQDWDVAGGHLAERCSLFIIIALGESVLVTGATVPDLPVTLAHASAFILAFIGSAAFWWIYFDTGAEAASERIARSDDPGHLARLAYTYIHLIIVAAIIVGAVGDELLLAHPDARLEPHVIAPILGGPILFVLGTALFKWAAKGWPPLSHVVGLLLLGGLTYGALNAPEQNALALTATVVAILCLIAGWESVSLRRGIRPKPASDAVPLESRP